MVAAVVVGAGAGETVGAGAMAAPSAAMPPSLSHLSVGLCLRDLPMIGSPWTTVLTNQLDEIVSDSVV